MANIYEKMLEVMKNIEYLNKDGKVEYGSTKYKGLSEEKVTTVVREQLLKQRLVVFPIEQDITKDGSITTTNTKYKMVNADNPEEYIILASSGQGSDSQDKGAGKAMTYSYKYMFLRTFALPSGEDPDKISSEQLDEEDDIRYLKETLEKHEDIETDKFLESMGKKFGRKVKSIDDMKEKIYEDKRSGKKHRELAYAVMRMKERVKEEK